MKKEILLMLKQECEKTQKEMLFFTFCVLKMRFLVYFYIFDVTKVAKLRTFKIK